MGHQFALIEDRCEKCGNSGLDIRKSSRQDRCPADHVVFDGEVLSVRPQEAAK